MYIMDIDLIVFYIFNNGILKNIVYVLSNIDSSATFVNIYIFYCFPIFIKITTFQWINIKYLIHSITEKY